MRKFMRQIIMLHNELLLTDLTREARLFLVRLFVLQQIVVSRKTLIANIAGKIFLPAVRRHVPQQMFLSHERFIAILASKRTKTRVKFHVLIQVLPALKGLSANIANVNFDGVIRVVSGVTRVRLLLTLNYFRVRDRGEVRVVLTLNVGVCGGSEVSGARRNAGAHLRLRADARNVYADKFGLRVFCVGAAVAESVLLGVILVFRRVISVWRGKENLHSNITY